MAADPSVRGDTRVAAVMFEAVSAIMHAESSPLRAPRPCSVCGAPRPCERRERRLIGRALAVGVRRDFGGLRCLTLRYSLPLSVWVDPHAEHIMNRSH